MEPTKEHIYSNDSPSQEQQRYNTKNQGAAEANSIRLRIRIQMWTKSPEDKRRHHIPAQAKPEGFPS